MRKNILIVSTECMPYQKIGGLADANADFSNAYKKNFQEDNITIILPLYNCDTQPSDELKINNFILEKLNISYSYNFGVNESNAIIYKVKNPFNNIPVLFIYSPAYSCGKAPYEGDVFRNSAAFSQAVLGYLDYGTENDNLLDIIQTTDFPVFINEYNFSNKKSYSPKILHIIHNAGTAYQSLTEPLQAVLCLGTNSQLKELFKDKDFVKLIKLLYKKYKKQFFYDLKNVCKFISNNYHEIKSDKNNANVLDILNLAAMKHIGKFIDPNNMLFNPIKKHILSVDYWLTDSPSYYKELLEDKRFSGELFETLKLCKYKSSSVLAGINQERYSPKNSNIKYNFDNTTVFENKLKNKEYLLENFSEKSIKNNSISQDLFISKEYQIKGFLNRNKEVPLIFMSSRNDIYQKGIDIAFFAIEEILQSYDIQIIFSFPNAFQNKYISDFVNYLSSNKNFNGKYVFIDGYIPFEQYCAGSDLFLMPSRFEPCGFSQLISMCFGCIPVVCSTGGLNDTITDYTQNQDLGNGFKTKDSFYNTNSPEQYKQTLKIALSTIKDNNKQRQLIKNAMNYDSSWNEGKIKAYNDVYTKIIKM